MRSAFFVWRRRRNLGFSFYKTRKNAHHHFLRMTSRLDTKIITYIFRRPKKSSLSFRCPHFFWRREVCALAHLRSLMPIVRSTVAFCWLWSPVWHCWKRCRLMQLKDLVAIRSRFEVQHAVTNSCAVILHVRSSYCRCNAKKIAFLLWFYVGQKLEHKKCFFTC